MIVSFEIPTPILYLLIQRLYTEGYLEFNDCYAAISDQLHNYGYLRIKWLLEASTEEIRQIGRYYQILWYGA